jgi:hypothetical protein
MIFVYVHLFDYRLFLSFILHGIGAMVNMLASSAVDDGFDTRRRTPNDDNNSHDPLGQVIK